MARLAVDARAVAVDAFDHRSAEELVESLVPTATALVDDAVGTLTELLDEHPEEASQLGSLALVVRGECHDCRQSLRLVAAGSPPNAIRILVQAERTRHTLTRGLVAVERKLSEHLSISSKTFRIDFVRESRAVRSATTQLRRNLAAKTRRDRDLPDRVRGAYTCLDALLQHEDFRRLRIYDRNVVRDLHRRLDDWLGDSERIREDGVSILNEALNLGELLRSVNDRLELVDHDLKTLDETIECLVDVPADRTVPREATERLGRLFGRDDVLDDLARQKDVSPGILLSRAQYVRRQVVRRMGGSGRP